jgi:hypothetical protein
VNLVRVCLDSSSLASHTVFILFLKSQLVLQNRKTKLFFQKFLHSQFVARIFGKFSVFSQRCHDQAPILLIFFFFVGTPAK